MALSYIWIDSSYLYKLASIFLLHNKCNLHLFLKTTEFCGTTWWLCYKSELPLHIFINHQVSFLLDNNSNNLYNNMFMNFVIQFYSWITSIYLLKSWRQLLIFNNINNLYKLPKILDSIVKPYHRSNWFFISFYLESDIPVI